MSTFINQADYTPYIRDARLTQLIDNTPGLLDDVEATAIAVVKDALYSRYDVEAIFALTDDNRPKQVVRWILCLCLYYLYERLPERLMPPHIQKNYEDASQTLTDIEDGKKSTNLPLLDPPEGYSVISKFRWGNNNARTHDF